MLVLPSYEYFLQARGRLFALLLGPEQALEVELHQVDQGVAMNARYECFSLLFLLPTGHALPQDQYRVRGQPGEEWDLMLTPVRSVVEQRPCLEAVFHREKALA
ncbi:MAG: hypothetical protein ABWY06_07610 [Pseudomonas sp.]|uniref:DUF6916 family protein n=1 Tax=Pseudomonas sp. TaxID=306 RepID=UPI003396D311